jgi:putative ABC transport system permease protein
MMLWNYLKLGIRNLVRQKIYSIINVVGLAIGLAAVIIISLYIQYELGFDRHITDNEQIYRCVEIQKPAGIPEQHVAVTMGPLGPAMKADFTEVSESVRLLYWGGRPFKYEGKQYNEEFTVFADPMIFDMFGVKLLIGDTATALKEPRSVVMSKAIAEKVFGSAENAMGKLVQFDVIEEGFMVTGVMEDQPKQSHLRMDLLIPYKTIESRFGMLRSWDSNSMDTFVRLAKNTDVKKLEEKFPDFIRKYTGDIEDDWEWSLYLQPLRDIHLHSGHIKFQVMNYHQGNIALIYIFGIMGILIIVMACINFINMAISRSVKRAREVGMRKVLGANRWNLANQFLGESLIMTCVSVVLALFIVELLIPSFSRILEIPFTIDFAGNWIFNFGLVGLILAVSLISGSYPAFYLSHFQPIKVLKGTTVSDGRSSGWLTKSLVVLQFTITISLLFCIGIIYRQYNYMIKKDLGLNYSNVITLPLYNNNTPEMMERIRNRFLQNPDITGISFTSGANGVGGSQGSINVDDSVKTPITCRFGWVDYEYFPMMEIPFVLGRNFSRDFALDEQEAIILNEAAVKALGWDDPIGKTFLPILDTVHKPKVIGVIRDYHYYSLHSKIEPAVYMIQPEKTYVVIVKALEGKQKEVTGFLEETWAALFPGVSFEYSFAEDDIRKDYSNEANILKIFTYLTILSIVISLLGLYGLTSLETEKRTREIGIRKVFGGSPRQIFFLVTKEFLLLIGIAAVITIPLSWYFMQQTLDNFAYRIPITADLAISATFIVFVIAILTVMFHVLRAANTDPVKALRYE